MPNSSKSPQGGIQFTLWLFLFLSSVSSAHAEPYLPQSGDEIVQRIPKYIAINTAPLDLESSIDLAAGLLLKAQHQSDPRAIGIALTKLQPWASTQSNELNLVRAGLLQYQHQFDAAISQLTLPISGRSPDPRALLLRANIHIVQGRYADAESDCAALLRTSDTAVSATCLSITHSLNGRLRKSYAALKSFATRFSQSDPAVQQWIAASLAEMAVRLGTDPTEHWNQALNIDPSNVPLLLEKSRWLIDNGDKTQARDILALLPVNLSRDVLLARTSRAPDIATLEKRFELAELADGVNAHAREYAEFLFHIAKRPQDAADKALLNWQQQREPIDLLILSQAAKVSGNQAAQHAATNFRRLTKIEDLRLDRMDGKS